MKINILGIALIGFWIGICHTAVHGQQPPAAEQPPATLTVQSPSAAHSIWDGVYTKEQATRGEMVYAENCAACHGPSLLGAEFAPPLTGLEFNSNWNGLTLSDLYERIRASMPQDDPSKITPAQKADALAYILSYGKFPAGMTELPRETPALEQIKFVATKP